MAAHTENLSMFGCFVETTAPFPAGTKVRLRISHAGANFTGQGTVAYSRPNGGMEITFTSMESNSLPVLDIWTREPKNVSSCWVAMVSSSPNRESKIQTKAFP